MATKFRNLGVLIGNVGKDPEARYTPAGKLMLTFSLAVEDRVRDGDGWKKVTDWFSFAAFDQQAEWLKRDIQKGTRLMVTYKLKPRSYEQDGRKVYVTDLRIQDYEVLRNGKTRDENEVAEGAGAGVDFGDGSFDGDIPF